MVPGHTKNRCEDAFGFEKHRLRQRDVITLGDMFHIVDKRTETKGAVSYTCIDWTDWKCFLLHFYTTLSGLTITKYHVFQFNSSHPNILNAKGISSSNAFDSFCLMKNILKLADVRSASDELLTSDTFILSITPLYRTPSTHWIGTRP